MLFLFVVSMGLEFPAFYNIDKFQRTVFLWTAGTLVKFEISETELVVIFDTWHYKYISQINLLPS